MSRFIHIDDVIKLPMLGERDYLMRNKGRYKTWAKYVWQDMEMSTFKSPIREVFHINKRTNTIDLPCSFLELCSVNVIDKCGVFWPVYLNDKLHDDIVDIPSDNNCACEYKCGYKMCNTIKGYEAVVTCKKDFNPDGTEVSFTCVDRKAIDNQGFFYEQTQYPLRVYLSGVWTETVLHTENKKLCKIEVDENGCACDSKDNIEKICGACGIGNLIPTGGDANTPPNKNDNTWIYYCNSKLDWFSTQCGSYPHGMNRNCNNIYNISELGDRLIFPHNFGYDKVMIRYYADANMNDLQIPFLAVDTFVMGLKWWDKKYSNNPKDIQLSELFGKKYALMKFGLLRELNKYRIEELGKIFTPPKFIPSNILSRSGYFFGYGFDNNTF